MGHRKNWIKISLEISLTCLMIKIVSYIFYQENIFINRDVERVVHFVSILFRRALKIFL